MNLMWTILMPIILGRKRWPLKHFVDTISVSSSPASPAGSCPLNFLNLVQVDLMFPVWVLHAILLIYPDFSLNKGFVTSLITKGVTSPA